MSGFLEVKLRRMDTSQPWGFRMRGGAQQGIPLTIEHVCGTVDGNNKRVVSRRVIA